MSARYATRCVGWKGLVEKGVIAHDRIALFRGTVLTCDFGDSLEARDRQSHDHTQVGPNKEETVTHEQAAHRNPLAPCESKKQGLV